MKSLALYALFSAFSFVTSARAADDPVKSFETFITAAAKASGSADWTYQHQKNHTWLRATGAVSDVRYDVKKTDSLVAPVVGEVHFMLRTSYSQPRDTAAAAAASPLLMTHVEQVTLRYVLQEGAWRPRSGESVHWTEAPALKSEAGRVTLPIGERELAAPTPAQAPWYRPTF